MVSEVVELYGHVENRMVTEPGALGPPDGVYLVGWEGGRPVAGGGLRRLDHETGESRRMDVVPERRRQGLGQRQLGALEGAAIGLGNPGLRLSTGPRQPGAWQLYEPAGYVPIPDYNG